MSVWAQALRSPRFLVTAELTPPKGTAIEEFAAKGEALQGIVDAINITDQQSSIMATSPVAMARLLAEKGLEPILQITCRDRNRIALQSDLLGASVLGLDNILCLTGDPVGTGDNPEAKTVFDLEAISLLKCASQLSAGKDMGGNELKGTPTFTLGGVVNPGAKDLTREMARLEQKIEAGAIFFQSQAVFDPDGFARFMEQAREYKVPILAGIIILKSARMARHMNEHLPGVHVPETLVNEMEQAENRSQTGIEIAGRIIRQIRDLCRGIHIMPIGWERHIPAVLEAAGLTKQPKQS